MVSGKGGTVLDMLRDLGWSIVEVEGIGFLAGIARGSRTVFIRAGASPAEVSRVLDRVLLVDLPG